MHDAVVIVVLVVWSQVTILVGAYLLHRQQKSQAAELAKTQDVVVKTLTSRKPPEPIVIPAPDLGPYLNHISKMGVDMAREMAAGVALIVQGPTQPANQPSVSPEGKSEDEVESGEDVVYPSWEEDPSWHLTDRMERPGDDWTAHTTPYANGNENSVRADGQPMFTSHPDL